MEKVVPFLCFESNAEEAARFYTSLFENSTIVEVTPMVVVFELDGRRFMALNGGPEFRFTEAFSMYVRCETQEEVDELWERLSEGGEKGRCGWLKDRYGLSWQIVPDPLIRLLKDPDPEKSRRVTEAMLKMSKLDVRALEAAAAPR
jgi:predicted 3-demethylubiquinone-9 3-methyltransferase (glyoxalase superfamily)